MTVWSVLGLLGFAVAVGAYVATLRGWIVPESLAYPSLSLLATALISASLVDEWNLTTFLMQVAFGGVSVWGIVRWFRNRVIPVWLLIRHYSSQKLF